MSDGEAGRMPRTILWAMVSVLAIIGVAAVGVFLVLRYVGDEESRDMLVWQTRLGIVAESRAAAVNNWLTEQRDALNRFVSLPAVGLYTDQLLSGGQADNDRSAIESYLTTTLRVAAEQAGWMDAQPGAGAPTGQAPPHGLAIIGPKGRVVASTPGFTPPDVSPGASAPAVSETTDARGATLLVWTAPVRSEEKGAIVATAVAVSPLEDLLPLLSQPGDTDQTASTDLIRVEGKVFSFLTRPQGQPSARTYDIETSDLAAAFAARSPGAFGTRRRYDGLEVLVTSRKITGLPWVIVRSISVDEALGPARNRRNSAAVVVVLAIVLSLIGILLIWRHGASIRVSRIAEEQRQRANRLDARSRLLTLVADGQPRAILALDAGGHIRFANRQAAEEASMTPDGMLGHTLPEVYGSARAQPLLTHAREALEQQQAVTTTETSNEEGDGRVIVNVHLPLGDGEGGTLILREDTTELAAERRRREDTLKGIMSTLLALIDRRDPHAADQSMHVAEVARALAEELGLEEAQVDTVTYAAALMNVGKIMVPTDILTKAQPLDSGELVSVKAALAESAALVADVDFDGPVSEAIANAHAFGEVSGEVSGAGDGEPAGEEDRAVFFGRIIGLANCFVAMVSARAWRGGMSMDTALAELRNRAAGNDDSRIVTALNHVLDNRGGRDRWRHFAGHGEEPEGGDAAS